MKYLVLSDIHGSAAYLKKFMQIAEGENPDKIILLGDIYYHGPRNALPEGYAPMEVAEMLFLNIHPYCYNNQFSSSSTDRSALFIKSSER